VVETIVPNQFQGYPSIVHGGIVACLVDEALGRAQMGNDLNNPRFMYTAKLSVQYRKPVPTNQPIRIVGIAVNTKKRIATSRAEIYGSDGELLVDAEAILVNIPDKVINSVDLEALGWRIYPDEEVTNDR
jgi:acyl-coenzyme A thioesterase PaaI-like protein